MNDTKNAGDTYLVNIAEGTDLNIDFNQVLPEEINMTLLPVKQLKPDMVPEPLKNWVFDISERMNCPVDYVATAAIVCMASIIGAGCGIKPKKFDDWFVVPNLWGGVVGHPSQLKSPSIAEAMKPLARLEADAKAFYEQEKATYTGKEMAYKAQVEAQKSAINKKAKAGENIEGMALDLSGIEAPKKPTEKRYKTSDSTVEKLTELLNENTKGILVFRDELMGLLASWDKQGRESDRAFYLEGWNGNSNHTCDRIGRGTTYVEQCCISLFGGIQPAKLEVYLMAASSYENDGLVQRLQMLVYPDPPAYKLVDRYPDTSAKNKVFAIAKELSTMSFEQAGATCDKFDKIPAFRFSDEAQAIFFKWYEAHEIKLRSGEDSALINEHLTKYRSLIPSLALVFHLVEVAEVSCENSAFFQSENFVPAIGIEPIQMAIKWSDYLESHARRIYGIVSTPIKNAAILLSKKIIARKLSDGFTARDVYRNEWQGLTKQEIAKDAIDYLVSANWLFETIPPNTGGRPPAPTYTINPLVFSQRSKSTN